MNSTIIVGAGNMAYEYSKVLNALDIRFDVIGRGEKSALEFEKKVGYRVIRGGVEAYLRSTEKCPDYAIVTVCPYDLSDITVELINKGIRNILVEKPGGMNCEEVEDIAACAKKTDAHVYIAYNRRFYASTIAASKMIEEDGGVTSFNFEFTEWEHVIRKYDIRSDELEGWFMANSTHVVDLAFFLGGVPDSIATFIDGSLNWHPIASRYSGAGTTSDGVLFSYKANWSAPGRWSVEVLTNKRKYLFEPLETLKIQEKGSVVVNSFELEDDLDKDYKPGLFRQTEAFLKNDSRRLIDVGQHARMAKLYKLMETNGFYKSEDGWNTFSSIL